MPQCPARRKYLPALQALHLQDLRREQAAVPQDLQVEFVYLVSVGMPCWFLLLCLAVQKFLLWPLPPFAPSISVVQFHVKVSQDSALGYELRHSLACSSLLSAQPRLWSLQAAQCVSCCRSSSLTVLTCELALSYTHKRRACCRPQAPWDPLSTQWQLTPAPCAH